MPILPGIRRLTAPDAAAYRDLRLDALRAHPESFGAAWEDEAARPLAWFAERLDRGVVFGAVGAAALLGTAGFLAVEGAKQRHKGLLWGLFVRPEARGTGLAPALVAQVVAHARGRVEELRLSVVAANGAAIRLYEGAGFVRYGVEPRALKLGDAYYDEVLMGLHLVPMPPIPEPSIVGP